MVSMGPVRLIALAPVALIVLGGCITNKAGQPVELTQQQVCLAHNEGNKMEQDRCMLPPDAKPGPVPDARPQDLPIRTRGPGDTY